jgi:predicted  nucleic acid-binding Zn-ribbon protein
MFNNDFYELKKALEVVTIEVTDLKKMLHEKNLEIQNLRVIKSNAEQFLKEKLIEQDVQIKELRIEKKQAETKSVQLRGEIQSLNDRIAGLVKENDLLKREAIARQMITKTFNGVKGLVGNLKSK